ncbi:MAG TPA: CAP domain-containing protein [Asticcacaulis sp.]|nr:CAP domain-containing protein [Asticcacaulis sp.]
MRILLSVCLILPLLAASAALAQPGRAAFEALDLINAARAEHGCQPLRLDARLTAAAERQSRSMARTHVFSHNDPDGSTPAARVSATGYVFQMVGENITANSDDPRDAVATWMNSPGHRANILTCAYRETGIAVADGAGDAATRGYGAYWTQVFAMPGPGRDQLAGR